MRLGASGRMWEDPGTEVRAVEVGLSAGLRFSFWAPSRAFEPLPEFEDP